MSDHSIGIFHSIEREQFEKIIYEIKNVKLGLIGDLCLDIYWKADMIRSKLSRETPHFPLPIIGESMFPGAGANVASNIIALNPDNLYVLGIIGEDWRGNILMHELQQRNIDTQYVVVSKDMVTNAYCKPIRKGISDVEYEDPRIDFTNYKLLSRVDENKIAGFLDNIVDKIDILCVVDQFQYGCITPFLREKIIELARHGLRVIVDSRDRIKLFTDVILKPNEFECCRAVYGEVNMEDVTWEQQLNAARKLALSNRSKVCMTLGPKGCVYIDGSTEVHITGHDVVPPIDICGAGDTFLSAFSCALASGANPVNAAAFAILASEVTITKIGVTGTANLEEIKDRYRKVLIN